MNATTVRVVNRETIESLENDKDKEILIPYLVNQPENVLHSRDFPPIPATESAQLSTNGQKIYQLLVNKDPKLTADLLAQIPESSKYSNDYLTTAIPNIKNLRAPLFVIADRGNTFQPFTDSRKVLAHLPKSQYTYVETDILKDGYLAQDLTFKKSHPEGTEKIEILKDSYLAQDLTFKKAVSQGLKIFFFVTSLLMKAT